MSLLGHSSFSSRAATSLTCSASHCRSFFWMVRSCFSAVEAALSAPSVVPAPAEDGAALLASLEILCTTVFSDLPSGNSQVQKQGCRAGCRRGAQASCMMRPPMSGPVSMLGHIAHAYHSVPEALLAHMACKGWLTEC